MKIARFFYVVFFLNLNDHDLVEIHIDLAHHNIFDDQRRILFHILSLHRNGTAVVGKETQCVGKAFRHQNIFDVTINAIIIVI